MATVVVLTLATSWSVSAQGKSVTFTAGRMSIRQALKEVSSDMGFAGLVYDSKRFNDNQIISVAAGNVTLEQAMKQVLNDTGLAYEVKNGLLLLVPDNTPKEPAKTKPVTAAVIPAPPVNTIQIPTKSIVTYDTVRTVIAHDGRYVYPDKGFEPDILAGETENPFGTLKPAVLSVKTNLLWWAAGGTLNIAGEVGLGRRTSLELSGGLNRWNLNGERNNNKKLTHWLVKPSFRYWLCERLNGHFFDVHAFYGQYNVGGYKIPMLFDKDSRYEGSAYGAGLGYGYDWMWSQRWGMEFNVGVGFAILDYDRYNCEKCGDHLSNQSKTYFGPTELGIKLMFIIK
jgi:hypothetical protein